MMEILKWIENWYSRQCDGEWEHSFKIKIETLDNPGWDLSIDLSDTELEDIKIPYRLFEKSESDWYGFKVEKNVFEAFGDPTKLKFLLQLFREFAENNSISGQV